MSGFSISTYTLLLNFLENLAFTSVLIELLKLELALYFFLVFAGKKHVA